MKKLVLIACLFCSTFIPAVLHAQINVNVNLGAQPQWGPSGYNQADYYYLPDIESYYSVPQKQFIYLNNGRWVFSPALPAQYSGYNLYKGYKVVLNTPRPYLNYNEDRVKYARYKAVRTQPTLKYKKTKIIHANPNGIPPGQAKKLENGSVIIEHEHGKGKDHDDDRYKEDKHEKKEGGKDHKHDKD